MVQFSIDDLRTPEGLERVLRQFENELKDNQKAQPQLPSIPELLAKLLPVIREQLQAPGTFPLNIQSLIPSSPAYSVTNVTTDRSYDASATTTAELANVLGTLIFDLQGKGILS